MGSLNKVQLIGNLGRDAELRYTQSGTAVASLNMATTETWKDKAGQKKEKTEWHRCVLWGKSAESLAPYLKKGKSIYVEGSLETRMWEKDGHKNYTTEIKIQKVVLLGGGSGGDSESRGSSGGRSSSSGRGGDDRDGYGNDDFLDGGGNDEEWTPPF